MITLFRRHIFCVFHCDIKWCFLVTWIENCIRNVDFDVTLERKIPVMYIIYCSKWCVIKKKKERARAAIGVRSLVDFTYNLPWYHM